MAAQNRNGLNAVKPKMAKTVNDIMHIVLQGKKANQCKHVFNPQKCELRIRENTA